MIFENTYLWFQDSDFYFQNKMKAFEKEHELPYSRECTQGHFTASMWVLNPHLTHVFLVRHKKLGIWLQPGGHADGDVLLIRVAEKELLEETGFKSHLFLSEAGFVSDPSLAVPFDFDIVFRDFMQGIEGHLHLDVCFCAQVDSSQEFLLCEDEVLDGKWFSLEELNASKEIAEARLGSRISRMVVKTQNFLNKLRSF